MSESEPHGAAVSLETFRERLAHVLQSHREISEVADDVSASVPPGVRREFRAVARFLSKPRSPEEVLTHPAALSICLPLVTEDGRGPRRDEIVSSIHTWISETAHRRWQSHRRIAAFAYPWVVLLLSMVIVVLLCIYLVPEFERMFSEFALQLPAPTRALIGLSHFITEYGAVTLIAGLLLAATFYGGARWRRSGKASAGRQQRRRSFESNQGALAEWARQAAALIQAGLARQDAVAIAGRLSAKRWLRHRTAAWAEAIAGPAPAAVRPLRVGGRDCQLIVHALALPEPTGQTAMLREAAAIYRARDQRDTGWWLAGLSQAAICGIGLIIAFVVGALFLPLVSLISGLS